MSNATHNTHVNLIVRERWVIRARIRQCAAHMLCNSNGIITENGWERTREKTRERERERERDQHHSLSGLKGACCLRESALDVLMSRSFAHSKHNFKHSLNHPSWCYKAVTQIGTMRIFGLRNFRPTITEMKWVKFTLICKNQSVNMNKNIRQFVDCPNNKIFKSFFKSYYAVNKIWGWFVHSCSNVNDTKNDSSII